jgi:hypothetical protein
MRCLACLLLATILPLALQAQTQAPAGQGIPAENLVSFDPNQLNLRWLNRGWQLAVGTTVLKDFGPHQAEALQALRIIRGLNLTQRGTVGTPPVMEYWLSGGQAPVGLGGGMRLLPIDLPSLSVAQVQGRWCLLDAHRVLLNFGARQNEAQQALGIFRKYGFSQAGYIGWPTPLMMYFLGGSATLSGTPSLARAPAPASRPEAPTTTPPGGRPSIAPGQLLAASMHQLAPPGGSTADGLRFDPNRVVVENDRGAWRLHFGKQVLATFGNPFEARLALSVLQYYRFTELYQIGSPAPVLSYFMVHGQPPHGLRFGVPTQAFNPELLTVQQMGPAREWMVCDKGQPILNCGNQRDDAEQVVDVIRQYQFDHLCRIGPVGPMSMTFLVKGR